MPKTIYLGEENSNCGIDITWTKTRQRLDIGGWYDSSVGIQSSEITLGVFFDLLGITEEDCRKAFRRI